MRSSVDRHSKSSSAAVDEVLVVQHVGQLRLDVAGRVHQHVVLDAVDVAGHPLEEGQHRGVDEDHAVLGVVHDVGELSGEEPHVEGVADGAGPGDAEVHLQVLVVVPGERPHAVAGGDAEGGEGGGEPPAATAEVGVGVVVHPAVGLPGADPLVRKHPGRVLDDAVERQRVVHHQAVHRFVLTARSVRRSPARVPECEPAWNEPAWNKPTGTGSPTHRSASSTHIGRFPPS